MRTPVRFRLALAVGLVPALGCSMVHNVAGQSANNALYDAPAMAARQSKCQDFSKAKVGLPEERALGGAVALNWVHRTNGLLLAKPELEEMNRYLNRVGKNLAQQSARPDLDWTFGVLNSDDVNAFSAPGGYVLVSRGLLKQLKNENQLAGVLAHEIAHVNRAHALEAYKTIKFRTCTASNLSGPAAQALNSQLAGNTGGALNLDDVGNSKLLASFTDDLVNSLLGGFQKDQEFEADRVGMELALNAGYRPDPFIELLGSLPSKGNWASVHPPGPERQAALQKYLVTLSKDSTSLLAADYPFQKYPVVAFKSELAAANTP